MKSTDASEIQNTILRSKTIAPAAPLLTVPLSFGIPRSMVAGARPMGAIPRAALTAEQPPPPPGLGTRPTH